MAYDLNMIMKPIKILQWVLLSSVITVLQQMSNGQILLMKAGEIKVVTKTLMIPCPKISFKDHLQRMYLSLSEHAWLVFI